MASSRTVPKAVLRWIRAYTLDLFKSTLLTRASIAVSLLNSNDRDGGSLISVTHKTILEWRQAK